MGMMMATKRKTRVLVVDDDAAVRETVAELLVELGGYAVEQAASGEEALKRFGEQPADVVLTDLDMTGMDGIELARQIRCSRPEARIILHTGRLSETVASEAEAAGIAAVVAKPASTSELDAEIRRVIRQ